MAKSKNVYICSACGFEAPRWTGQCPSCRAWNTMAEERASDVGAAMGTARHARRARPGRIEDLASVRAATEKRWKTGIGEFDRVLGGGVVPGSVVLSGGEPGVGKSTLFLQAAGKLLRHGSVLYVSGEESPSQIKMRADRLNVETGIRVMAETELGSIIAGIEEMRPRFLIVDSIQTLHDETLSSAPGTVTQVRTGVSQIAQLAKRHGMPVFLIGHVTKEGAIAGPRVVEHLVDTVLYFEGDRTTDLRILRAVKNRFGGTDEIGMFEMRDSGMQEAALGTDLTWLSRPDLDGIAVYPATQGTRPMLLEIQALCAPTQSNSPRRTSSGIDPNRLLMVCAILEKKIGLRLGAQDIFVNVTGDIRVRDRASDLACAMAIISSLRSKPLPSGTAFIGELGLSGEIRPASHAYPRLSECARMGMKRAVVSSATASQDHSRLPHGLEVVGARTLFDACEYVL